MKITSGEYKYRKIEIPQGIRPTTEKVREAVFSMIREWIPGAVVIDLFAGSGAMGLEALSRGAEKCWFCDINRRNFKVLLGNIAECGAGERSQALNCDYRTAAARISDKADIVILDPPYDNISYYADAMMLLLENGILDSGSVIVCEHLHEDPLPETCGRLRRIREKKYGTIGVDVYICE